MEENRTISSIGSIIQKIQLKKMNEATIEIIEMQTKTDEKQSKKQKRSQNLHEFADKNDANTIDSTNEQTNININPHKLSVESDKGNLLQNLPSEKRKRIIKAILAPLISSPASQASLKSLNQKILHFNSLISEISENGENSENSENSEDSENSETDRIDNGTALETIILLNQVGNSTIRARTRLALQQAFYRYARLFLIARKGFKDAGSAVRAANVENNLKLPQRLEINTRMMNEHDFNINGEMNDEYATNSGKANFEAGQAFAIFILEVFGAVFGLTIGLIGQIQAGFM